MNIYYLTPHCNIKKSIHNIKTIIEGFYNKISRDEEIRGDTQIIFKHCDLLRKNGFNAIPIHIGKDKLHNPNWFFHNTHLKHLSQEDIQCINDEDVIICPNASPELICNFERGKKYLFVQNWAKYRIRTAENYGFNGIITLSGFCSEYIRANTNLPVYDVQNGIELEHFNYSYSMKKEDKVLILYRKNQELIDDFMEKMPPDLRKHFKFNIVEKKVNKAELISLYQESDMFLNFGYPEGFGLMPLEAMACGCVVGGYTGQGAKSHMIDKETALVVEDGRVEGMYEVLYELMKNPHIKGEIRKKGLNKVKEFSLLNMEQSLLSTIDSILKTTK